MEVTCRRLASTAARSVEQESRLGGKKGGIRDVLSKLNANPSEHPAEVGRNVKGKSRGTSIRDLVRARSSQLQSDISKLSQVEYAQKSLTNHVRDQYADQSSIESLQSQKVSQNDFHKLIAKSDHAQTSTEKDTQDAFEDFSNMNADDYSSLLLLSPGDLVEYWPDSGIRRTGVILRIPDEQSGKRYLLFDERGAIDYTNPNRFRFIIPEFISEKLIPAKSLLLSSDADFEPFRRALNQFKSGVEKVSRSDARLLATIYEHLPEHLREKSSVISSADVCKMLFGETTHARLFATFEAMTHDRVHFLPDPVLHMSVPLFSTRSAANVDMITKVTEWTRTSSAELSGFVARARKIAAYGRAVSNQVDGELLSHDCEIKYTRSDRIILDFMLKACLERKDRPEDEIYTTPLSVIIKALDIMPELRLGRSQAHACLKKLGVIAPWDTNLRRLEAAALPGQGASEIADEYAAYEESSFGRNQVESLSELGLRDHSDASRHDFGSLPAYAIDGRNASELDDALSLDGDWLHIHIADPSSFIVPGTRLANMAEFRVETSYGADRVYPMLPWHLAMRHFSLRTAKANPAMTISIRLGEDGALLETTVRPSIIRNVKQFVYEDVDRTVFGISSESKLISRIAANWRQNEDESGLGSEASTCIDDQDKDTLLRIDHYLRRARNYRIGHGMIDFHNTDHDVAFQPDVLPSHPINLPQARFYSGRPGISYSTLLQATSRSRTMVSEAAIQANSATAQYAIRHRIPVIYKVLRSTFNPEEKKRVLDMRDPDGRLKFEEVQALMSKFGTGRMLLEHGPFELMGLPNGYTLATSPLRRYADMVAQWHIQAHLRGQPYPVDLKKLLPMLIRRGKALKRIDKAQSRHWLLQILSQKLESGVPQEFTATVYLNNSLSHLPTEAIIQDLSAKCLVRRRALDPVTPVGSQIRIVIEELDLMDDAIYCRRVNDA